MERNSNHNRGDGLLLRSATAQNSGVGGATRSPVTTSPDFVLQWGNRKRLRCMKVQLKDRDNNNKESSTRNDLQGSVRVQRTTGRVNRRAVRSDYSSNKDPPNQPGCNGANGYINLRQRTTASPAQRILRNSESSISMRGHINGVKGLTSLDRGGGGGGAEVGKTNCTHQQGNNYNNKSNNNRNENDNGTLSSDSKKGEGSSSGSDVIPAVWPPKFVIALTNKEKEEDFIAIKGSKLPQRPKKRAKFIQRTLNLVSPGAWLCDLTLERYEVREREKKITKKRPRGLKAMGDMDSESE